MEKVKLYVKGDFDKNGQIRSGYDHEQESTKKLLRPDSRYEVDNIIVHSWNTEVYLKGFNMPFNSVTLVGVNFDMSKEIERIWARSK